jgi:hypothetical protein
MRISGASHRWFAPWHEVQSVYRKISCRLSKLVQQHSGDWTMTGKVPVARVEGRLPKAPYPTGRMKDIAHIKTMAGSPDADRTQPSASRNLAHGFPVPGFHAFCETMKENRNVQYSFSRDRLGWTTSQA